MTAGPAHQAGEPFVRLGQRVKEELAKVGLRLLGYSIDPDLEGGPLRTRLAVVADDTASSDPDLDAALAGMLQATALEDQERRAQEARDQLAGLGDVIKDSRKGVLGEE